ncbi:Serine/threonine-protein kinase smg-1 [Trichinella britovi]|uniref:Serine/threonine-protein kinase smg-1 n=1 Tax=Trichinella britovi TaxID=45882 RepID=A0A0V1CFK9_TRIBR|nr:Serine/threonine-protein kinase smg-1 [Trichinella britovi]
MVDYQSSIFYTVSMLRNLLFIMYSDSSSLWLSNADSMTEAVDLSTLWSKIRTILYATDGDVKELVQACEQFKTLFESQANSDGHVQTSISIIDVAVGFEKFFTVSRFNEEFLRCIQSLLLPLTMNAAEGEIVKLFKYLVDRIYDLRFECKQAMLLKIVSELMTTSRVILCFADSLYLLASLFKMQCMGFYYPNTLELFLEIFLRCFGLLIPIVGMPDDFFQILLRLLVVLQPRADKKKQSDRLIRVGRKVLHLYFPEDFQRGTNILLALIKVAQDDAERFKNGLNFNEHCKYSRRIWRSVSLFNSMISIFSTEERQWNQHREFLQFLNTMVPMLTSIAVLMLHSSAIVNLATRSIAQLHELLPAGDKCIFLKSIVELGFLFLDPNLTLLYLDIESILELIKQIIVHKDRCLSAVHVSALIGPYGILPKLRFHQEATIVRLTMEIYRSLLLLKGDLCSIMSYRQHKITSVSIFNRMIVGELVVSLEMLACRGEVEGLDQQPLKIEFDNIWNSQLESDVQLSELKFILHFNASLLMLVCRSEAFRWISIANVPDIYSVLTGNSLLSSKWLTAFFPSVHYALLMLLRIYCTSYRHFSSDEILCMLRKQGTYNFHDYVEMIKQLLMNDGISVAVRKLLYEWINCIFSVVIKDDDFKSAYSADLVELAWAAVTFHCDIIKCKDEFLCMLVQIFYSQFSYPKIVREKLYATILLASCYSCDECVSRGLQDILPEFSYEIFHLKYFTDTAKFMIQYCSTRTEVEVLINEYPGSVWMMALTMLANCCIENRLKTIYGPKSSSILHLVEIALGSVTRVASSSDRTQLADQLSAERLHSVQCNFLLYFVEILYKMMYRCYTNIDPQAHVGLGSFYRINWNSFDAYFRKIRPSIVGLASRQGEYETVLMWISRLSSSDPILDETPPWGIYSFLLNVVDAYVMLQAAPSVIGFSHWIENKLKIDDQLIKICSHKASEQYEITASMLTDWVMSVESGNNSNPDVVDVLSIQIKYCYEEIVDCFVKLGDWSMAATWLKRGKQSCGVPVYKWQPLVDYIERMANLAANLEKREAKIDGGDGDADQQQLVKKRPTDYRNFLCYVDCTFLNIMENNEFGSDGMEEKLHILLQDLETRRFLCSTYMKPLSLCKDYEIRLDIIKVLENACRWKNWILGPVDTSQLRIDQLTVMYSIFCMTNVLPCGREVCLSDFCTSFAKRARKTGNLNLCMRIWRRHFGCNSTAELCSFLLVLIARNGIRFERQHCRRCGVVIGGAVLSNFSQSSPPLRGLVEFDHFQFGRRKRLTWNVICPDVRKVCTSSFALEKLHEWWEARHGHLFNLYNTLCESYFVILRNNYPDDFITVDATIQIIRLVTSHYTDLKDCLHDGFSSVDVGCWKPVIPQLFAHLGHRNAGVRTLFADVLCSMAVEFPAMVIYPALAGLSGDGKHYRPAESQFRQNCCKRILDCLSELYPQMVRDTTEFVAELKRIILLHDEVWYSLLTSMRPEVARRLRDFYQNQEQQLPISDERKEQLKRGKTLLMKKMLHADLAEQTKNKSWLLKMEEISPKLAEMKDTMIPIPGVFENDQPVMIKSVVNIDYNVCFEKGKLLRVPETVPFRLTQNIVNALGISGVENSISQLNNLHGFRQKVDDAFSKPPQCFIELAVEFLRATGQTQKIQPYKNLESKIVPSFSALRELCNNLLDLVEAYRSAQLLVPAVDRKKHRLHVWLELLESVSKCSCDSGGGGGGGLEANVQQTERLLEQIGQQQQRGGRTSPEQFYANACRTVRMFQSVLDNGEKMPTIRAGDLKKIFANTADMGPVFIASSETALVNWLASIANEMSRLEEGNCCTKADDQGSSAEQQARGMVSFGWMDIYLTVLKYLQSVRQLLVLPAFEKFSNQSILQRLDAGQRLFQCCVSLVEQISTFLVPTMYRVTVDNHAELSSWLMGVVDACATASTLSMDKAWQTLADEQLPVGMEWLEADNFDSHHLLDQLQRINDELRVRKPIFSHRVGDEAMTVFRHCLDSFMAIKDHLKLLLDCLPQGGGRGGSLPLPTVDYRWSIVLDFIYNYTMYRCASVAVSYAEGDQSASVSAVFVDLPDAVGTMLWKKLLLNSLPSALLNNVVDSVNNFRLSTPNDVPVSDAHPMVQQYQTDIRNFVQTVQIELTKDACEVLKNALVPLNGLIAVELCDRFILIADSLYNYESLKLDSEQLVKLDNAMVENVKLYLKQLKRYMSIAAGMDPAEIELAKLKPSQEEHVTEKWLLSILADFEKRHSEANQALTKVQDEFFAKKTNFHAITESVRLLLNEHRKFTAEARAYMKHLAFSGDEIEAKLANFFLHLQKLHTLAFSDVLRTDITSLPDTWDFEATKVAFKRAAYLTNTIFDVLIDFVDPEAASSHSKARVCRLNYLILKFTVGNQSKSPNLILDVKSRSGKLNALALNAWKCVRAKLEGRNSNSEIPLSIADQVDALISDATNLDNLALMYEGWTAWV